MADIKKYIAKVKEEIEACGVDCALPISDMDIVIRSVGDQIYVNVKCKVPGEKTNNLISVVYDRLRVYGKLMGVVVKNAPYEFDLTLTIDAI